MPLTLLKQRQQPQKMPSWMNKAQSLSTIAEIRREESRAANIDEQWHEYEDDIDERALCNSFIVNDPGQCFDKSETHKNWMKFIEESSHPITILDNSIEHNPMQRSEIRRNEPYKAWKDSRWKDSPYTRMSNLTLQHLALNGDKQAIRTLNFRGGNLAKQLGVEILFEYGEMQNNGNLLIKTGWAGSEEAAFYRSKLQ